MEEPAACETPLEPTVFQGVGRYTEPPATTSIPLHFVINTDPSPFRINHRSLSISKLIINN